MYVHVPLLYTQHQFIWDFQFCFLIIILFRNLPPQYEYMYKFLWSFCMNLYEIHSTWNTIVKQYCITKKELYLRWNDNKTHNGVFFLGFQATYALGLVLGIGACAWIYFLNHDNAKQVYGAVILLGLGGSTMLVTSLAMTSDLIACNVVGLIYFDTKIFLLLPWTRLHSVN